MDKVLPREGKDLDEPAEKTMLLPRGSTGEGVVNEDRERNGIKDKRKVKAWMEKLKMWKRWRRSKKWKRYENVRLRHKQ